jgi:hypothetical protein
MYVGMIFENFVDILFYPHLASDLWAAPLKLLAFILAFLRNKGHYHEFLE